MYREQKRRVAFADAIAILAVTCAVGLLYIPLIVS